MSKLVGLNKVGHLFHATGAWPGRPCNTATGFTWNERRRVFAQILSSECVELSHQLLGHKMDTGHWKLVPRATDATQPGRYLQLWGQEH